VKTVRFVLAQTTAMDLDAAMRTSLAIAHTDGLVLIALCRLAPRSALVTGFATMVHASANQDLPGFTAPFLLVLHPALATVFAFLSETR